MLRRCHWKQTLHTQTFHFSVNTKSVKRTFLNKQSQTTTWFSANQTSYKATFLKTFIHQQIKVELNKRPRLWRSLLPVMYDGAVVRCFSGSSTLSACCSIQSHMENTWGGWQRLRASYRPWEQRWQSDGQRSWPDRSSGLDERTFDLRSGAAAREPSVCHFNSVGYSSLCLSSVWKTCCWRTRFFFFHSCNETHPAKFICLSITSASQRVAQELDLMILLHVAWIFFFFFSHRDKQPFTPTDNLEFPIDLACIFYLTVGGSRTTRGEPTVTIAWLKLQKI